MAISNMFTGSMTPRDVTAFTLFRGVTDFSNLVQFNNFESGYSFLIVLSIPKFLDNLCAQNNGYKTLIQSYRHILEYEFKGISGFDDITSETSEISNGVSNLQLITKVNMQSASQFSMRYTEKSGLTLAKVNELFLRGIKDPKSQVKTYNGLLADGTMSEAGYEFETFSFLYFVTDNTTLNIEKAYLIVAAQPTTAGLAEVSNSERGEIGWKEVDMQFNGIPLVGPGVTAKARLFLDWIHKNTVFEESKFGYKALTEMANPGQTGGVDASSPTVSY